MFALSIFTACTITIIFINFAFQPFCSRTTLPAPIIEYKLTELRHSQQLCLCCLTNCQCRPFSTVRSGLPHQLSAWINWCYDTDHVQCQCRSLLTVRSVLPHQLSVCILVNYYVCYDIDHVHCQCGPFSTVMSATTDHVQRQCRPFSTVMSVLPHQLSV